MKSKIKNTKPFYSLTTEETLEVLGSQRQGLSQQDAERRLQEFGLNELPAPKREGVLKLFLGQFKSPLIYTLLISSLIVLALGEVLDAIIITAVLLINAIVGSIQEGRAQAALDALKKLATGTAVVVRAGESLVIPEEEVVPGDTLVLREGEKVMADCRVLESFGLLVDESMLSGESLSVAKIVEVLDGKDIPLQDRQNMLFKGTLVTKGSGTCVVVNTGINTEMGEISKALVEVKHEIPLQAKITSLSHKLILLVLAISIILFFIGFLKGLALPELFSATIALAVSIIPEGLPVAVTVILASGVWRMSKRKALVKKLQAVEALAHTSVLAVDKTGTITKNELVVQELWLRKNAVSYEVTGQGFDPSGELLENGKQILVSDSGELLYLGKLAALVADAEVVQEPSEKRWKVASGDSTDAAVLVLAGKLGFRKAVVIDGGELVESIPFDYSRKFHAVCYRINNELHFAAMGAVEAIALLCKLDTATKKQITNVALRLARKGLRAIALAGKSVRDAKFTLTESSGEPELPGLEFLGILGMADQLFEGVEASVAKLDDSGIRTVMITGDTPHTGQAIATRAGIYKPGDTVLTGAQLKNLSANELELLLDKVSVFARVVPQDKMKIIQAFGRQGHTIAMTGDGVNDAPALLAADLGIAMGERGTGVAREAADIVLLDDNFSTIVAAAEEGRGIYRTIQKVLVYLFSTSVAELIPIVGAVSLGLGLPVTGAQIVWLNFVTDGFLTVALGLEPTEKLGQLKAKVNTKAGLLGKWELARIFWLGGVMGILSLCVFISAKSQGLVYASSLTLTFLAVVQWFNAWNCRSSASIFSKEFFKNKGLLAATAVTVLLQVLAIHWGPLQKLLHTQSLSLQDWVFLIILGSAIIAADEIWKAVALFINRKNNV